MAESQRKQKERVKLLADCNAYQVPSGQVIDLSAGTEVEISQSLGGNITVNVDGNLAQIPASEAHVLGEQYRQKVAPFEEDESKPLEERVWDALRTCYDPEIPVNIVDLGLVYECRISELLDGRTRVDIRMTLTAPGCGMGPVIAGDAKNKVASLKGVDVAHVEMVYDPPWSRDMMSEAALLELGLL